MGDCHCGTEGLFQPGASSPGDASEGRRAGAAMAIAAVLDGSSREEAAKIGGMDRQTLRDWVIRFNEQGADGLINIPSPGMPPKLTLVSFARDRSRLEGGVRHAK